MSSRPLIIPGQLMFDDPALRPHQSAPTAGVVSNSDSGKPERRHAAREAGGLSSGLGTADADVALPSGLGEADGASDPAGSVLSPPKLEVEVIRSKRRTKTAQARLVGSTVEIRIPWGCSSGEEQELVEHFTAKFERSRSTEAIDLDQRAGQLAERYGLPKPTSIRWVSNQQYRWGSCTPSDGSIRLSDRLAEFPGWVIDYVMVHELAHLLVSGHDAEFWALVEAYPLSERARGFLIAKGLEGE